MLHSPPPHSAPPTPAGGGRPHDPAPVDYAAFAAHYEKENQMLREQLWTMRRILDGKEGQCAHNSKLLAMAMQEGDAIAGHSQALMQRYPQFAGILWQVDPGVVIPQPTPSGSPGSTLHAASPPPSPPPEEDGSKAPPGSVPLTPSRRVLQLSNMTPGPKAGSYMGPPPLAPAPSMPPAGLPSPAPSLAPSPSPSPAGTPGSRLVPTPCKVPTSAPPAYNAPGSLSPEPGKKKQPPETHPVAQTPPPKGEAQQHQSSFPAAPALPGR
eukprot:TRINITY_DN6334_c0_g1_i1.p1 TRINITY_DN6334_c0_g1~~TRINITY_DN6334_c0_g1_i1.p1  ORF type:complete len:267 (-),score=67.29 TRINITY_DN6334_c0_g1_i1:143-943(-)